MTKEETVRQMLRELVGAGWHEIRHDGRHENWGCPCGSHQAPVPTSHRTVSPGVVRKIRQAITACPQSRKG